MSLLDGKDHVLTHGFPLFKALSNAVFHAMTPWLPKQADTAMLALLGEAIVLGRYECTRTGQYSQEELRGCLHETLDDLLDIAFDDQE